MFVETKIFDLIEATFNGSFSENENAAEFEKTIKKKVSFIKKIVEIDFKEMSDENFYDLLTEIYSITLTDSDYLDIISRINNKKYTHFSEIDTQMTFNETAAEGHGRDFSWCQQLYQIRYLIAVAENVNLSLYPTLSKNEIKKLIADKSIVLLQKKAKPLNKKPDFTKEKLEKLPMIHCGRYGYVIKDEYFHYTVSLLREKFTKGIVLKDIRTIFDDLQDKINIILQGKYSDHEHSKIANLCNDWYKNSDEKKECKDLAKKLYPKKRFGFLSNSVSKK